MTSGRTWQLKPIFPVPVILAGLLALGGGTLPAGAQAEGTTAASSGNTATAAADTTADDSAPASSLMEAGKKAISADKNSQADSTVAVTAGLSLLSFSSIPKAGVKANVRQYTFYGEDVTNLALGGGGSFRNAANWSWDDFRKQEKTIEMRSDDFKFNAGKMLPFVFDMNGKWDWTNDLTTNTAGFTNLSRRENKTGTLSASHSKFQTGALTNLLKADVQINDQKSINQNQPNNFNETTLSGGYQGGVAIASGINLAGRIYGKTTSGERVLGSTHSPSSASADSTGFGVYYQRSLNTGRFAVTRSNFDRKYLDFKKNSNGLIDTVGVAERDKVVDELETKDALSTEFENTFKLRRVSLKVKLGRDTDELDYRVSRIGLKKKEQDTMDLTWGFGVGRDSVSVSYKYLWKWDDQRIKGATEFRGRQYQKARDVDLTWLRPLIGRTMMTFKYHEGLTQDIAQNEYNQNDKDRLQTDLSLRLDRAWPNRFRTTMIFSYKQAQDISIRESRSSNNNIKDSYEISPGYLWTLASWLTWDQSYQTFIQYTDYTFSELESVNRDDNYNKRGNLSTKVTIKPTSRLDVVVQHDYNKRFNATRVTTDATGASFYHKDQKQTISKIDLGVTFRMAEGVTLEGATFQTEDTKDILGKRDITTITRSGEVWVGTKVNKVWGETSPVELSAMVKKYNAFGPSVNATSADYWESDVWLKWEF